MRTIIAFICFGWISLFQLDAQTVNAKGVPQEVKATFAKKYPGAAVKKWEKAGNQYKANFMWHAKKSIATFTAQGGYVQIEQYLALSDVPADLTTSLQKNLPGFTAKEVIKQYDVNSHITYFVIAGKGKERVKAIFNNEGNFVRKFDLPPANDAPAPKKKKAVKKK